MLKQHNQLMRSSHWSVKKSKLLADGVRHLFSKTGIWDPKLTKEIRFEIEEHWKPLIQEFDKKQSELAANDDSDCKPKFYALSMFPYPSGNLHMGHVRVYTISDTMARYQRLQGKRVIHPVGWDAFGLPAENAAIERGVKPKEWTYSNIERMRKQFKEMALSFDWNREFATCDPAYYKWTQFIFLKMFEKGLVFQQKGLVNWDPVDMTVLASEQIDDTGRSWRSGVTAEKKYLRQWYLRNTVFSESLLEGLNEVDPALWRDIILLQRNWISDLTGRRVVFKLVMPDGSEECPLSLYTEHIDLIYGVSHLLVSLSHHLCVDYGITQPGSVLPSRAVHPLTGKLIPIVAVKEDDIASKRDSMLGIPSVCSMSKETAQKLDIPFIEVLDPSSHTLINSNHLTGLSRKEAAEKVCKEMKEKGIGGERISSRLHDWLISRQRYWGTPIPIIHCPTCKVVPVPYEDLPVELPDRDQLTTKDGKSPLAEDKDWLHVTCPKCGGAATRETDTMDTFVDSSWYYLRYLDPHNTQLPFEPSKVNKMMPVDLYVGGKEHAVLHLYYARFINHFLHSIGLVKHREPFRDLLTQGMVKALTFRIKDTGRYFHRNLVDLTDNGGAVLKETGEELLMEWDKMGKSKFNGINPEDVLSEFGVDSTRLCMVANVAPQSDRQWCNSTYKGILNWQGRIWSLVSRKIELHNTGTESNNLAEAAKETDKIEWEKKINNTRNLILNNVNFQFERTFNINSAISRMQSLVTWLLQVPEGVIPTSTAYERCLADLIILISPITPHFASELWVGLKQAQQFDTHAWEKNVLEQSWPCIDEDFLMPLTLQVNHVKMAEVGVPYKSFDTLNKDQALKFVQEDSYFKTHFSGLSIKSSQLKVVAGHKAQISLSIPEFSQDVKGETSAQKRKEMKKLNKQKKKLHHL